MSIDLDNFRNQEQIQKEQCRGATRNEAKTSEENANGERWNCDRLVERSDVTTEIARHWCSVRRRTVMLLRSATKKEGENEKSDVSGTSVTGYSDAQRECGCEERGVFVLRMAQI